MTHRVTLLLLSVLVACSNTEKGPTGVGEKTAPAPNESKGRLPVPTVPPVARAPSGPPTDEEWASQKREATVKGSTALNCETKVVRGYLRVKCGANASGASTMLEVLSPLPDDSIVKSTEDELLLVHPYASGTSLLAVFSWEKVSHELEVHWPRGAPTPPITGVFKGAESPLDRLAPSTSEQVTLLAAVQASPADCEGSFNPAQGSPDGATYATLVQRLTKDHKAIGRCQAADAGGFHCTLGFHEGWNVGDDHGWSSVISFAFDVSQKRVLDEGSLRCHAAG